MMMIRAVILSIATVLLAVTPGNDWESDMPIPVVPIESVATTSTTMPVPSSTVPVPVVTSVQVVHVDVTTSTLVPSTARCPEWWVVAIGAGWDHDLPTLLTLDWIMWRESRCQPDAVGDGSYGLTQLQWSVHSRWIRAQGFSRDDLLNPAVNLALAKQLFDMLEDDPAYICGFSAWYMSQPGEHWCEVWKGFQ